MSKSLISYVNGRYMYHPLASVHIEDRGFQFADGVYEVVANLNGRWVDMDGHMERLEYSLKELKMDMPMGRKALEMVINRLVRLNRITSSCYIYLQVSRGVAPRNHIFPMVAKPSLVITVKRFSPPKLADALIGSKVITGVETRWARPDIKSVSLLPNILAKQEAHEQGAIEYWFIKDDIITEGGSSNAWIVNHDKELITHPSDGQILKGITREYILAIAKKESLKVVERGFSLEEAYKAKEAFVSSSTALVRPICQVNDKKVNDGKVGDITRKVIEKIYEDYDL
ncbi:MAG: D-amino-acid transaminase [Alphaproteobacteria bacterium]